MRFEPGVRFKKMSATNKCVITKNDSVFYLGCVKLEKLLPDEEDSLFIYYRLDDFFKINGKCKIKLREQIETIIFVVHKAGMIKLSFLLIRYQGIPY